MPKYRKLIEDNFLIDDAKTGELIPFKFNKVQLIYYNTLVEEYDIEKKGIEAAVREIILKARREGFSSFILALFAADDILSKNPTETSVISYKDDATKTFVKRYKTYITSFFKNKCNITDPRQIFEVDSGKELVLRHNKARFCCGTASARVAGRGGVLQKLLFSEAAHYPDTEIMTAKEIIDGTLRQVDISSGLVFMETTANGYGNYYEQTWSQAVKGNHRFKPRFYGWRDFYTEDEFKLIASEFTDKEMLKQEYPETPEEAFITSGSSYFDNSLIFEYIKKCPEPLYKGFMEGEFIEAENGNVEIWETPQEFASYTIGGDTAEGIEGGDYSVLVVINNKTLKTVAKFKDRVPPDEMAKIAYDLGILYNNAYMGIEVNKDGLWVNTELFKKGYKNLYYREAIDDIKNSVTSKLGFKTSELTRPYILSELRKMLSEFPNIWNNKGLLEECLVFVRNKMGRPQAMSGKNDDEIMATAIAYEIRRNAPVAFEQEQKLTPNQSIIEQRLEKLYGKKQADYSQNFYLK